MPVLYFSNSNIVYGLSASQDTYCHCEVPEANAETPLMYKKGIIYGCSSRHGQKWPHSKTCIM